MWARLWSALADANARVRPGRSGCSGSVVPGGGRGQGDCANAVPLQRCALEPTFDERAEHRTFDQLALGALHDLHGRPGRGTVHALVQAAGQSQVGCTHGGRDRGGGAVQTLSQVKPRPTRVAAAAMVRAVPVHVGGRGATGIQLAAALEPRRQHAVLRASGGLCPDRLFTISVHWWSGWTTTTGHTVFARAHATCWHRA